MPTHHILATIYFSSNRQGLELLIEGINEVFAKRERVGKKK
jgi:hypothetical protein